MIIELVLADGDEPDLAKMIDLVMLAMLPGRERTAAEYRALLAKAGFTLDRIVPSTQQWLPGQSVIAVASGGVEGVSYERGLILGAVYLVAAVAAAMTVFLRRDVTA